MSGQAPPPSPTIDVLAVGNALVDLTVEVEDDLIRRHGLPRGDMLLTDAARFAAVLRDAGAPTRVSYGGTACNTAGGIAAFGQSAAFVGKLAHDALGALLRDELASAGVAFATPALTGTQTTASCLILVTPDGQRTGVTQLGACGELDEADVEAAGTGSARVVLTEAYLLDRPRSARAFHRALALGRQRGARTALTLADPHCVTRHREDLRALLAAGAIDILFANEAEARALTGAPDARTALQRLEPMVGIAAVTCGAAGALIQSEGRIHATPALSARVVDATGAGDLYAAGVLVGLLAGHDAPAASWLGAAAAAEAVGHFTARPAVSLEPLLRELQRRGSSVPRGHGLTFV